MNKLIMIKPRYSTLLLAIVSFVFSVSAFAQHTDTADKGASYGEFIVTGTVTDASTHEPLVGVNITVEGFSSEFTSEEGSFTISVPSLQSTLLLVYPNKASKEVALKGRSSVAIALMESDFYTVYGDINSALGVQSKVSVTNALSTLEGDLTSSKLSSSDLFGGQFSGVRSIMRSGSPGVGANMFIRGYNSILGSSQPLIVLDGMILETETYSSSLISGYKYDPLADINPKDIANITVIKDASSLYGSKGSNGVILIETVKATEISTKVDFFVQGGLNFTPSNIPVMNASSYKTYLVDQLNGSGLYSADEVSKLPYLNESSSFTDFNKYNNNTDWQKEVFENSFSQDYYFRVTGGDEIAKYALTLGFMDNAGIISDTKSQHITTRFNAQSQVTKRFSIATNFGVGYQTNTLFDDGINDNTSPIYNSLLKSPMLAPTIIGSDGILTNIYEDVDPIAGISNPAVLVNDVNSKNLNYNLFGSFTLAYDFTDNLKLTSLIGTNYVYNRDDEFTPSNGVSASYDQYGTKLIRSAGTRLESYFSMYNDTRLAYTFDLADNKHDLAVAVGSRYNSNDYENSYSQNGNSGDDEFTSLGDGDKETNITSGSLGVWKYASLYGNAQYSFLRKYFLDLNVSYEGSSRFGKAQGGNQYGLFPSLGAAWLVSSEDFMQNVTFLDQLKLRASFGVTGNDQIGNYNSQSYFVSTYFLEGSGLVSGNIANTEMQWERTRKANIGLDIALLNERVQVNFDMYKHVTDNLIQPTAINSIYGYSSYLSNEGELTNQGFELGIQGRIINAKDFKWDLGANVATYTNEVTSMPGGSTEYYYSSIDATVITEVGGPVGAFYGYETDGIYNTSDEASKANLNWKDYSGAEQAYVAGDVKFVDQNDDDIIDDKDKVTIGNANPDFTGMVNTTFTYKDFSLSALFTFSQGNKIYNALRRNLESMDGLTNQSAAVQNRWQVDGQETSMPRASYGDDCGNSAFSDRWIEDGSYVRLKTLSLSYSPDILTDYVNNISFHLSANNLFTFTDYLGYDPEVTMSSQSIQQGIDVGYTPQFTSVFLGVKIGL